jgi:hypothetical protein
MGNKSTSVNASRLLDNKLSIILKELNESLKDAPIEEKELLLIKFNNVMDKFYKTLANPILRLDPVKPGVVPDYRQLNKYMLEIGQDLETIYSEINSIHSFMIENFNTLNSMGGSIRARIRKIASDVGDYKLYASDNLGGATYFCDTFKNMDKIDFADRLYREEKCFIDVMSGIATLPIDNGKTEARAVDNIFIGTASNGQLGNNQEIGALARNRLQAISDNNPDTWVEYESVEQEVTSEPLLLELRFKLDEDSIVNTLDISTTAFATKRHPRITKIEVSQDGRAFTSVMDEVVGKVKGQNQDFISLNPTAENISGSNKVYFKPRKIRYINIVFQQSDTYIIRTPSGTAFRKAIGIRDINIIGQAYKPKGELVSIDYSAPDEIKKVALEITSDEIPNLTDVKSFISNNDGQDWYEIQPLAELASGAPEIINFNTGIEGEISTNIPVSTIRYKGFLERSGESFGAKTGVITQQIDTAEFASIAPGTQELAIENQPIPGTTKIFNVSYGSVGTEEFYFIPRTQIVERDGQNFVFLPTSPFAKNSIAEDQEIVRVKDQTWRRVADLSAASAEKVYEFDYVNNIIKFGDDTNGLNPAFDIEFGLERERVLISNDLPRVAQTTFSTDGIKEGTKIYRLEAPENVAGRVLRKAGKIHNLGQLDIQSISVTTDTTNVLASEQVYVNGVTELSSSGEYSIDYVNGILYTYDETPDSSDVVIDFTYKPRVEVVDFSFRDGLIQIPDSDYVSQKVSETASLSGTNVIRLTQSYIEPRSIRFLTLGSNFKKEVPFIGDGSEFNLNLTPAQLQGYYTVDYKNGIIYTYDSVSGSLSLEYNRTEYYAEYNIAVEVPRDDYQVDPDSSAITFSDRYIVKTFSNSISTALTRTLFRIEYSFAEEIQQNPKELEPFFTPILEDYKLSIITRELL